MMVILAIATLMPATLLAQDDSSREPAVDVVYVPEAELPAMIQQDKPGVLLSIEKFLEIWNQANGQTQSDPALNPLSVTHINYRARLVGKQMLVTAECRVQGKKSGWGQLQLNVPGWNLESAKIKEAPALMVRLPQELAGAAVQLVDASKIVLASNPHTYAVLAEVTGETVLTLELSKPLELMSDRLSARCDWITAPSSKLTVEIPEGMVVSVPKQDQFPALSYPVKGEGESASQKEFSLMLGTRPVLTLEYQRQSDARQQSSITLATSSIGIHLTPAGASWISNSRLDFPGQEKSEVSVRLPENLDVVSVDSTAMAGWSVSEERVLSVQFRQPKVNACEFQIRGILQTAFDADKNQQGLTLAGFAFDDVLSHTGVVRFKTPENARLVFVETTGMRSEAADESQPAAATLSEVPGFTTDLVFWNQDYKLDATLTVKPRAVYVAQTTVLDLTEARVSLKSIADVKTLFAPLFNIDVNTPADWQIESITINDLPAEWTTQPLEAGGNALKIELPQPLAIGQSVNLIIQAEPAALSWPPAADDVTIALPTLSIQNVDVLEGAYGITSSDDLDLVTSEMTGLSPASLGLTSERFGFRYQQPEISGQLAVKFKNVHLSAMVLAVYRLERQTMDAYFETTLTIEQRGLQELEVRLPESVGADVQFQTMGSSTRVLQQSTGAVEQARRPFLLRFNQRHLGELKLACHVRVPKPSLDDRTIVDLPQLTIPSANRFWGYMCLLADDDQQLTLTATDAQNAPLSMVDRAELPASALLNNARVVSSVRFATTGAKAQINEVRFDRVALPSAVCQNATLETVLDPRQQAQHHAHLTMLVSGVQSLHVSLPEKSTLWAILLNNKPVESRRVSDGLVIPLAGINTEASTSMTCDLYYATDETDGSAQALRQDYVATPPMVQVVDGQGTRQPLEIIQEAWKLHTPRGYQISDGQGDFLLTSNQAHPLNLFERLRAMLDPNRSGDFAVRIAIVGGLLVALLVIVPWLTSAVAERPKNVAVGCLVLVICGVVLTLFLPSRQGGRQVDFFAGNGDTATSVGVASKSSSQSELYFEAEQLARTPAMKPETGSGTTPSAAFDFALEEEFAGRRDQRNRARGAMGGMGGGGLGGGGFTDDGFQGGSVGNAPGGAGFSRFGTQPPAAGSLPAQDGLAVQSPSPIVPQSSATPADAPAPAPTTIVAGVAVTGAGGLLSIPMTLQVPETYQSYDLHYDGVQAATQPLKLDVTLHNNLLLRAVMSIVMAGTALLLWMLRRLSVKAQVGMVATGLTLPLALAIFSAPLLTSICLGLFLGVLLGTGLLISHRMLGAIKRATEAESRRHRSATVTMLMLAALILGSQSTVHAQEPVSKSGGLVGHMTAQPGLTQIIVPYDPKQGFQRAIDQVYLSREEFLKLHQASTQAVSKMPAPGIRSSILNASFDLPLVDVFSSTGDTTRTEFPLNGRLLVYVFDETVSESQPIELTLPVEELTLSEATVNGKTATIRPSDDGKTVRVLLTTTGSNVIDFKSTLKGSMDASGAQLRGFFQPVTSGLLTVTLPKDRFDLRFNQQDNTFRLSTQNDRDVFQIGISAGGPIQITLDPKRDRAERKQIVDAQGFQQYRLREDVLELSTTYRITVRQGELLELPIKLSEGLKLRTMAGVDLAGWQFEEGQNEGKLYFRRAISNSTDLKLTCYLPLAQDDQFTLDLPTVELPNVTRETGRWLLLEHDFLEIDRVDNLTGLIQVEYDASLWPDDVLKSRARVFSCYRYVAKPTAATITLSRKSTSYDVTSLHGVMVQKDRVKLASSITIDAGQMPTRQLSLSLPFGALVLDAFAEELDDWVVDPDFGELRVFFRTPRSGKIQLNLELQVTRDTAEPLIALDLPRVSGAVSQEAYVGFWLQGGYSGVMTAYAGWTPISPNELPAGLKKLSSLPASFAFRTRQLEPDFVTVSLQQAPLVATCDGMVLTAVSDTSVDHGLTLRWQVRQSATDQFDCLVSSQITDDLEWKGDGIREVRQTPGPDGKTRWTILLHQPVSSEYVLTGTASLPYPQNQQVLMPKIEFIQQQSDDATKFTSITSQTTFGVLVNLSEQQVLPLKPELLETVAPDELTLQVRPELVVQASEILRLRPQGEDLIWQIRRGIVQRVAEASVNDASLSTKLSADGSWRTTAIYTIKNISRQFIALSLPEKSTLLSVQVAGKPSRAVATTIENRPVMLVPLPATSEADLSFEVKVITQGRLDATLPKTGTPGSETISLPVLQVISPQESDVFGIPVAYTRWNVMLPGGYTATIVRQSDKTNLVETSLESSQAKYLSGLLAEFDEFNRYATDLGVSQKLRSTAVDNQKVLAERINEAQRELQRQSGQAATKEVNEFQSKAGQSFQAYEKNLTNLYSSTVQQAADPQVSNGRGLVEGNNSYFYAQNKDAVRQESSENMFRFGVEVLERKKSESTWEDATKSKADSDFDGDGSERAKLSRNFANQNSILNESLESRSGMKQQLAPMQSGSPIGLPGPPHIPLGGPAGLQSHTIRNNTSTPMGIDLNGTLTYNQPQSGNGVESSGGVAAWGMPMAGEPIGLPGPAQAPVVSTGKGLSFLLDLPQAEPNLALMKVGGQPMLTIQVRTSATAGLAIKAVWFVGLLLSLALVLWGLRDMDGSGTLPGPARLGLAILGVMLVVLTEGFLLAIGVVVLASVVLLQLIAMLGARLSQTA
jgi:hypothetical protein